MTREVIRVSGRAPDVGDFLREAMLSQRFADVALCCSGGQRFLAHRLVLSAASPYLQEVLLAHSKGVEYCEPITVILAEMEGPELAAILGFVYTGSATVPRPRLNAFMRAAETLHIRLPPLPVVMKNYMTDCNPEDVKDVKISTKYLECEQYPLNDYDRSFNKRDLVSRGFDDFSRTVSHPSSKIFQPPENTLNNRNDLFFENRFPIETSYWQANHENVLTSGREQKNVNYLDDTRSDSLKNQRIYTLEVPDVLNNPYLTKRPGDQLDSENVDAMEMRISSDPCRFESVNHELRGDTDRLASFEGGGSQANYQIEERPEDRFMKERVPPLYYEPSERSNNFERLDYLQTGQDLSCKESCCRWKPPRRHVANQVTASPWKQLTRPHHCPKIQPIVLQNHSDTPVHSRTHSGEKPFRCVDCGKQFSQLRNYKYHRSVHEGTREFAATCPECGKYFNDRGYLSSHMKIHRNRKEYACGECGKSFNQRVAYNMHVRIHTGVKPHQCEQCGKAFSRKMLLKQHLRTHSGERPYQCQVCHKAFADRSNMTLHTRLHSGLKPYQCTLCSKAFTKKHHLKTHLNYHTGTKPYSCPNCGLRFSQSSNMRTHYKKCAINNPDGIRNNQNELLLSNPESHKLVLQKVAKSPTATLTPPNSDQESTSFTSLT